MRDQGKYTIVVQVAYHILVNNKGGGLTGKLLGYTPRAKTMAPLGPQAPSTIE